MEKKSVKGYVLTICLVLIFSFFGGYYTSYRIHETGKSKIDIIREIMENEWYYGIDDEDISKTIEEKIILGMMDLNTDPFTRYLTSLGALADSFTGIGISVSLYGEHVIISEVSSKSAMDAGLKPNDIITAIDGVSTSNKTTEEFSNLIKDKSSCVLSINRGGESLNITVPIASYKPLTVFTKEYGTNVSYVKISEFNFDTADYLNDYFSNLDPAYKNLVLDLRGNPGGYISSVKQVLDLFVGANKIVMTTTDKKGNNTVIKTTDDFHYLFDKIVVLINGNTASGAEALSAALNYHLDNDVVLYGSTTYGKGSAQKTYTFKDGTYFHYTYALWKTPYGNTINHIGVSPEVEYTNNGISSITMYNKELKLYDYGEEVLALQKFLTLTGDYTGELHSFMDEMTVNALKTFQNRYSLEESGKTDNNTIRVIAKLIYDDNLTFLDTELTAALGVFA